MPLAAQIEGRNVYLAEGKKSLTVNVCHFRNERGDYEYIVRVLRPRVVTEAEIAARASVADLIDWLKTEKDGEVEKGQPSQLDPGITPAKPPFPGRRGAMAAESSSAGRVGGWARSCWRSGPWLLVHSKDMSGSQCQTGPGPRSPGAYIAGRGARD
jgi:hypothetical protein